MATFNGARYLREQLVSVLAQLDRDDEVIISEDGSTDATLQILESFHDSRIKVLPFVGRLGPTRAFERAINHSSGDYIFLCDQDDVWLPEKVNISIKLLQEIRAVAVVSDARVIDADGKTMLESYQTWRKVREGFWANWLKNGYLGCCMAFRSSVKRIILPFPRYINMHDEWIGLCCAAIGVVRITKMRLIAYRRHDGNVTHMKRGSMMFMLQKRAAFLFAIGFRLLSLRMSRSEGEGVG